MLKIKQEIIQLGIDQLNPAPYNPRSITRKEIEKLKKSISTNGFVGTIVVNKDFTIIGGHQRVKALKELGEKEVWCSVVDLKKQQEKALNLALNKIGGDFDDAMLLDLLQGLDEDIRKATGFSGRDIDRLEFKLGNDINRTLQEDYIIPPFSIFDTKQDYWKERKAEWVKKIGNSGNGRDEDLLGDGLDKLADIGGTSIFDPVLTEVLYTWYASKGSLIIDPFAGGSTRGLVASMLGHSYIGTDVRKEQVDANVQQAKVLGESKAKWILDDGKNLEKHVQKGEADMLLTCPPYYDLEVYSDQKDDISNLPTYADFKAEYTYILNRTHNLLKDGAIAVIVVGNVRDKKTGELHNLVGDTISIMQQAGFKYHNEIILATAVGTAAIRARNTFKKDGKVVKTHQNILFFGKGKETAINGVLKDLLLSGTTATAHKDVLVFKKAKLSTSKK
jgi:DNA modification methylase